MKRSLTSFFFVVFFFTAVLGSAQDNPVLATAGASAPLQNIQLLPPNLEAGATLMQAISKRKSSREFDPAPLTQQQLSDILWVAGGYNRPESKGLVIPTAMGSRELDVYAMLPDGIYRYDPENHLLTLVNPGDHRAKAGKQPFPAHAPLNLFFVVDESRMKTRESEARKINGAMTTAYASENVYLYCASSDLATVVRGSIDIPVLTKLLKLKPSQKLYLGQSVGRALAFTW